jgi:hypothetical protein
MAISIAELIGSFNEAWSGKTELLDAVVTDDWDDIPLAPGQKPGRAGLRATIEGMNKAFSDFRFVAEEIIDARGEDGNGMVGVRSTMRGVQSHRDYAPNNVVFRDWLPAALIDFDLARPTTRLYDIVNALWYWAPLRTGDPRDRPPALADADIPHRAAVFADAYGMTAQERAELAPLAVDIARRCHEDSRASAELDPVWRKMWEDGGKDVLPRAEAWVREMAPAIAARLSQRG